MHAADTRNREVAIRTTAVVVFALATGCTGQVPSPPLVLPSIQGSMTWPNGSEMQEWTGGFIAADYVYQGASPILIVLHDSLESGLSQNHRSSPGTKETFHECSDRLRGPAGMVIWSSRNEGRGFETVKFNDREFQLEKGRVFLASVRMQATPLTQLPTDGTSLRLLDIHASHEQQVAEVKTKIEDLAKREPTVSAFFRKRAPAAR